MLHILFTFKKGENLALSSLKKLNYYLLEYLRFITTVLDKMKIPATTKPVPIDSPVLGSSGFSSVVVVPGTSGFEVVVVVGEVVVEAVVGASVVVVEVVVGASVVVVEVVVGASVVVVVEVVAGSSVVVVVEVVVGPSVVVVVEVVVDSSVVVEVVVVVGSSDVVVVVVEVVLDSSDVVVVVVEVVLDSSDVVVVVVEVVLGSSVVVVVVVEVVVVVVVVVVVLSPLPSPEPVSKRVKALTERDFWKLLAVHSKTLATLVPFGSSEVNSVVYSMYIAQFQLSPKLMVKPVIFPSAFRVNSALLLKLSIGSNLRSAASFGIFSG